MEEKFDFSQPGDAPLDIALAELCRRVEALAQGSRTGVCIASPDHAKLERAVFPSLPATFQATLTDLPMGPPYIGCCTAAMDGKEVITSHDLTHESRFSEAFIATCLEHGIKSLQSRPVYGRDQQPIGTFVMGYGEPSEDQRFAAPYMEFAADAVAALLQEELDKTEK
ncbi:GAF domain-containing protein [Occallatibacter savannae]|uniref:GAF domain-containing protein n=1 Tax=Occallatibacter savannae TaxID=1002691 RepID=UPI000D6893D1|nr:hypothetical protein [Occallatibacter savannae]